MASAELYLNQFLLGPEFADLTAWQRIAVAQGQLKLTAHPDLNCAQVTQGARELTLVGHLLDPATPTASNFEILQKLVEEFSTRDALIAATSGLGGRWLIIAADGAEKFLFHDALGLRQAFYTVPAVTGNLWVMSQPGLASEVLTLTPDEEALRFIDSETMRRTFEGRWPGAASPFKGLKHLLPNHWLDLASGTIQRYWPTTSLPRITPAAAIDRLAVLLPGLVRAAAARFDLALGMTAGIDSRLVLAAARDVVGQLRIVTVRQGRMPDKHADVEVPAQLLAQLDIPHQVIYAASTMSPEFSLRFKRNFHLAHDHYGHDAEAILKALGRKHATITGSGAEVGRLPFRFKLPHADRVRYTPELVAWLEFGSTQPFIVAHFQEWLDDVGRQSHVKLLDMLEWEQDYGNWLAMVQLQFDIAWQDIFTPYNCREVFIAMLGVDERYRQPHDCFLFKEVIRKLWPELLDAPINPHNSPGAWARSYGRIRALKNYYMFRRQQASS